VPNPAFSPSIPQSTRLRRANLFGGIHAAVGAAFFEPGVPGPFFAADAVVEYVHGSEASAGLGGRATLAGGLAGSVPFPWSVSAKALAGDTAANPRAELLAEASTIPRDLGGIGQFRLAAAAGYSIEALPNYLASLVFRSTFELEGREYRGALAKGLAARADMEAFWSPEDGSAAAAAGASIVAALRFGDKAGLSGRAGLRYDGFGKDDWKRLLRLPKATTTLSGDLGFSASCELPVLFARGRLFMSEDGFVEFFLKPYAEILFLRASGSGLFASGNLHGDGGLELAMTVDADRRDALRLGGGFDFSSWLQGLADFLFQGLRRICRIFDRDVGENVEQQQYRFGVRLTVFLVLFSLSVAALPAREKSGPWVEVDGTAVYEVGSYGERSRNAV